MKCSAMCRSEMPKLKTRLPVQAAGFLFAEMDKNC